MTMQHILPAVLATVFALSTVPAQAEMKNQWVDYGHGDTKLKAEGLGAFIAQATEAGDYHRVVLGIAVMSVLVVTFNRLLWRPLYALAERRFRLD